jgi:hypothetical protein
MIFYKPKYFKLYELVPSDVYTERGDRAWQLLDPRLLYTIDHIRKYFGKMIVNDWYWGGKNQYRVWRPEGLKFGAGYSQHKYGRAADLIPTETTTEKIRQYIIGNPHMDGLEYLTALELEVSWLHVDCRLWDKARHGLYLFKP